MADGPTRGDFFNEMLACGGTSQTSKFHGYHEAGFSVQPLEVLERFPKFAQASGARPRALLVTGPHGPLWTYHVLTFFSEGEGVRCNSLVMPHARITGKSSGVFTHANVSQFLREVQASPLLSSGDPDVPFDFLVADFTTDPPAVRFGNISAAADSTLVEGLLDVLNRYLRSLRTTYEIRRRGRYAHFPCPTGVLSETRRVGSTR